MGTDAASVGRRLRSYSMGPLTALPARLVAAARRLRDVLVRRPSSGSVLLGLGAAVGLGTGLLAAALIGVVRGVQHVAFGASPGPLTILLATTVGALLVGVLITYWVPEASGSGVIRTMETIALRGGRFRAGVPAGGIAASGLALGTGTSGGREGPIVLIGGSVGSLLGRLFALDEDRKRTLVAAGVAAGIGASFNAPIGGMLFAIELILGGFRARSLQVIVIASVVGSITARQIVGPEVIYKPAQTYELGDPRELLLYALLGLAAVAFGLGFIHGVDLARRLVGRLRLWRPVKLALGGLGVGLVALVLPEVLGTGAELPPIAGTRNPIQAMIDASPDFGSGWAAVGTLLLLGVGKLAATSVALGSGNAVGTFAPALFTGAALGGAFGHLTDVLLPGAGVHPGAFALVGMAAVFSAAARAPLTSVVIAFELTGDYDLVLPLMLAAGIAVFVADRLQSESVYTYPLRQRGIMYAEPDEVDIMQTVTVSEVMTAPPDTVPADMPLDELREEFRRTGHHGFPVVEANDRLVGVVSLADLARADRDTAGRPPGRTAAGSSPRTSGTPRTPQSTPALTAGDICTRQPVTVVPADPVFRALRRMASLDVGRIPVVASDDHRRLVGLIRRTDLVTAYQRAVVRTMGVQQRQETSRLRDLVGAHFIELVITPEAPAAGRAVRDVDWPERTVLTGIRRGGELIMPHGDTVLMTNDEVVVLTGSDATDRIRQLLTGGADLEAPSGTPPADPGDGHTPPRPSWSHRED